MTALNLALQKTFGARYMSSNDLFTKSLTTKAVPAMGHKAALIWIIVDNDRGEAVVRRHYEHMLQLDSQLSGKEIKLEPYSGPSTLVQRLRQQGYEIEMTIFPEGYKDILKYIDLKHELFKSKEWDVQAVCYNLDARVMPTVEMEEKCE